VAWLLGVTKKRQFATDSNECANCLIPGLFYWFFRINIDLSTFNQPRAHLNSSFNKIELNPKTLAVEIWEINPLGADLVSDGSHVGTLSKDLSRIEAVWTDAGLQRQGDLMLIF